MKKEYFKDKKTITVDDDIWKKLQQIRIENKLERINDVIERLLK